MIAIESLYVESPIGGLRLYEQDGAIIRIDWRQTPEPSDDVSGNEARSTLLVQAAEQLDDYFARRRQTFDLPLKPAGASLNQAVWQAMLQIPFGRTRTYGEVSTELQSTAQEVGAACGANPIPIIIPCHRILAAGGRLGGYSGRGGVETKRWLLHFEGALPQLDLF